MTANSELSPLRFPERQPKNSREWRLEINTKKARPSQAAGQTSSAGVTLTEEQLNAASAEPQDHSRKFLIGWQGFNHAQFDGCPSASTMYGWSIELAATVVIQIRCKRWSCPHCGQRKMTHFAHRVAAARPTRFITLTCANRRYETPREAYDDTRRALSKLTTRIRKNYGEFEYFRILETTRKGWPHYHLIARSPYIPQPDLSKRWASLTGATIVHIRQVDKTAHTYKYVMKYLGKQHHVPWTDRRLSWTRNFFVEDDFEKGPSLNMPTPSWDGLPPSFVLEEHFKGYTATEFSRDCWIIGDRFTGTKNYALGAKPIRPQ